MKQVLNDCLNMQSVLLKLRSIQVQTLVPKHFYKLQMKVHHLYSFRTPIQIIYFHEFLSMQKHYLQIIQFSL